MNNGKKQEKATHRHDWEKGDIGGMPYLKCKVKTCGKVSFPGKPVRKVRGAFGGRLKVARKPKAPPQKPKQKKA